MWTLQGRQHCAILHSGLARMALRSNIYKRLLMVCIEKEMTWPSPSRDPRVTPWVHFYIMYIYMYALNTLTKPCAFCYISVWPGFRCGDVSRLWGTGGTNPIRGADTQLGDDGDVNRAMGNVMPCEWRIWNDVVALSGRKWRHIHCFSPSSASAPPFMLVFTPVLHCCAHLYHSLLV
jgi:hypothetical protein